MVAGIVGEVSGGEATDVGLVGQAVERRQLGVQIILVQHDGLGRSVDGRVSVKGRFVQAQGSCRCLSDGGGRRWLRHWLRHWLGHRLGLGRRHWLWLPRWHWLRFWLPHRFWRWFLWWRRRIAG